MSPADWTALDNPFTTAFQDSRKGLHAFFVDHYGKLQTRAPEHADLAAIFLGTQPVRTAWLADYGAWQQDRNQWHGATTLVENIVATLRVAPPGGGRSILDEWVSQIEACFATGSEDYQAFLPQGREPFTKSGYEALLAALNTFQGALAQRINPLQGAQAAAQAAVDALVAANLPVPPEMAKALRLAKLRAETVDALAAEVATFHQKLLTARTAQNALEAKVDNDVATLTMTTANVFLHLHANFGLLLGHFLTVNVQSDDPQLAVAAFYDLAQLGPNAPAPPPDDPPPPGP